MTRSILRNNYIINRINIEVRSQDKKSQRPI